VLSRVTRRRQRRFGKTHNRLLTFGSLSRGQMMLQHADGGGLSKDRNSILIVDDTVANLLAFSAILKQLDCRIVLAANGREALERTEEEDFTLILMDVRMPELNGFEAAAAIRSRSRNRGTPILFLSAFETPPFHVFSSFVGGHTDFLSSPVDAETLLRRVREFLNTHGGKEQKDPSDPRLQKASSTSEEGPSSGPSSDHPRPSGTAF